MPSHTVKKKAAKKARPRIIKLKGSRPVERKVARKVKRKEPRDVKKKDTSNVVLVKARKPSKRAKDKSSPFLKEPSNVIKRNRKRMA